MRRGVFVSSWPRSIENDEGSRAMSQSASASVTLLRAASLRVSLVREASVVVSAYVEIKFRAPHAIDTMLSP